MVDKNILFRKIADLEQRIKEITEFSKITQEEYESDWKVQRIIERTLQIMIEICIDISNHIIADNKYGIPQSYADAFIMLYRNKIIDRKLKDTMIKMVGFRNIIVHEYFKIDPKIVVNILQNNLKDFDKFKTAILKYVKKEL